MPNVIPIYLATVNQTEAPEASMVALIVEADIIVQLVLLILALMSMACWVVILNKAMTIRRAVVQSQAFLDLFWKSRRLDEVYDRSRRFKGSPVAEVFKAGYIELSKLTGQDGDPQAAAAGANSIVLAGEENLGRALRRAASVERTKMESMTTFLATTGSTAPFIGLFGTVWGILRAFQKIDITGQATLATVGGDISHALIATAVGLAAAIPAVMAYNFFNSRIRVLTNEMENFSSDFLNIVKRHFRGR
jgi:biopolymer transport protein TolQ